jgi:hypothetical protein
MPSSTRGCARNRLSPAAALKALVECEPCDGWRVSGAPNRISRSPSATFGTQVILVDTSVWIEGL